MTWIVHTAHTSNYPNPIHFQAGDRVELGIQDDEFPGWIWVMTHDGNQGWAPIQYLQMGDAGTTGIAMHDYSAQELNTKIGQELVLHYELKGWGWVENDHGECGWVPMQTIHLVEESTE